MFWDETAVDTLIAEVIGQEQRGHQMTRVQQQHPPLKLLPGLRACLLNYVSASTASTAGIP